MHMTPVDEIHQEVGSGMSTQTDDLDGEDWGAPVQSRGRPGLLAGAA
jgi:hypothetical protein